MKFLHCSDLHLGKRLNEFDLLEDQRQVLDQIGQLAGQHGVQAVLIAGDVYDKTIPPSQAMSVFGAFVSGLAQAGIAVYAISGNHDSPERVAYCSQLVRRCGVYVAQPFQGQLQHDTRTDEYGTIQIYSLPFLKPALVRRYYPDAQIVTYEDALRTVLNQTVLDPTCRNILLCHQFVAGSTTCESEECAIGGLDQISASLFDAFDYVALGHLHGPQSISRPTVRYCGSPLKYSFSETSQKKSVTLVELEEKGNVKITPLPLRQPHDMRQVQGSLDELLQLPYSEDYIRAVVTDEQVRPDARVLLLTVFPNLMRFAVENSKTKTDVAVQACHSLQHQSPLELFCDFYAYQNNQVPPDDARKQLVAQLLQQLEETT